MTALVADSAGLIGLARIGRLDVLRAVVRDVLVPPAVVREVGPGVAGAVREVGLVVRPHPATRRLGPGETEAITLALHLGLPVLLDDRDARLVARRLEVEVIGLAGLLLRAKEIGHVPEVRPLLDALLAADFRLSRRLYDDALRLAGELPPPAAR